MTTPSKIKPTEGKGIKEKYPFSKKKEFEVLFGFRKVEQDGYSYLGIIPNATTNSIFDWIITNFRPKDEKR